MLTGGILLAAFAALGTWRAQVIGGRQASLAEQCLDAAHDFAVRIKVLRMEETSRERQFEELRKVLLEFQRILLRLNYYMTAPVGDDIPKSVIECYATLYNNFHILKECGFKQPESVDGDSVYASGAAALNKQRYQCARNIFYGSAEPDQVVVKLNAATAQLGAALRPVLKPARGWIGRMIDKATSAI